MCSIMFQICCTTSRLFLTTINMFSHISVYGMYFFYLRFLHIHNLFRFTYGPLLCCARAFEVEVQNSLPHPSIQTEPSRDFYLFLDMLEVFSLLLISYALKFSLSLSKHVVVSLLLSNSLDCIALLMCPIFSLTCTIVSLKCPIFSLTLNLKIWFEHASHF